MKTSTISCKVHPPADSSVINSMNLPRQNKTQAFTLIELLVVIAIIVVLAGITSGGVGLVKRQVAKAVTKARFAEYISAIELLKNDNGFYPNFGEETSSDGDLTFPQSRGWTDFWKTLYAMKSPEESPDLERLGSDEARALGNPRRKQHLKPSDENHFRLSGGELDWNTIKGVYKESKKDREQIFLIIDMDGDGKFENPDPKNNDEYPFVNKSIGFYSKDIKKGSEGEILFKTWQD